MSTAFNDNTKP